MALAEAIEAGRILLKAIEEPLQLPGRELPRFVGLSGLAGSAALISNVASARRKRESQNPSAGFRTRIAGFSDELAAAVDRLHNVDQDHERAVVVTSWPAQLRGKQISPLDIYPDLTRILGDMRRAQVLRALELSRER